MSSIIRRFAIRVKPAKGNARSVSKISMAEEGDMRRPTILAITLLLIAGPIDAGAGAPSDGVRSVSLDGRDAASGRDRARPDLEREAGQLAAAAAQTWPDSFAGLWIDPEGAERIYVAFTSGASRRVRALSTSFSRPDLLVAITATTSLRELERRQDRMIQDRELARKGALAFPGIDGALYDMDIDVRNNALMVIVEHLSPETAKAFHDRYGRDVRVVRSRIMKPHRCDAGSCKSSLRSGVNIYWNGGSCTSAFTTTGGAGMFTAGHCAVVGRTMLHDSTTVGTVTKTIEAGSVDASLITSSNELYLGAWIRKTPDHAWTVNSTSQYATLAIGSTACVSGTFTDTNCGSVLSKTYSPSYIPGGTNFILADFCERPGDSGAGVYNGSQALGINSGGTTGNCDPGHRAIFGHVEFAQAALGATVGFSTAEPQPVFVALENVRHGVASFVVRFNKPVACDVTSFYYEVKTKSLLGVPVGHDVTGRGCSDDSDNTIELSVSPPPVVLTTLEVTLWRGEEDPSGRPVMTATQSSPVLL